MSKGENRKSLVARFATRDTGGHDRAVPLVAFRCDIRVGASRGRNGWLGHSCVDALLTEVFGRRSVGPHAHYIGTIAAGGGRHDRCDASRAGQYWSRRAIAHRYVRRRLLCRTRRWTRVVRYRRGTSRRRRRWRRLGGHCSRSPRLAQRSRSAHHIAVDICCLPADDLWAQTVLATQRPRQPSG